jgi:hypothetical protein
MTESYPPPPSHAPAAALPTTSAFPAMPPMSAMPAAHAVAPVAFGLAMKRRNPAAVWIGLPLITLGIYGYVWYYKINKEMAELDRRRAISASGPLLVLIFLSWTVIAPIISFHNTGKRIQNAQRAAGLVPTCSPTLCWLLAIVFGLNTLYMQMQLNKIVDTYPGATPGMQIPLYA